MDVLATQQAVEFVGRQGGRLFVWKLPGRC
jgi:hypothetical protein